MGSVTRTSNIRLGIHMGQTDRQMQAIGWALFEQNRPKPAGRQLYGDVLEMTRRAAKQQKKQALPLTVFTYLNDDAYAPSIAAKDGISRADHSEMVESVAAQLAAENFDIIICGVE